MSDQPEEPRDSILIQRALARQKDGATILHSKYMRLVKKILGRFGTNPATVDDLAQEVFQRAFLNLKSLEATKKIRGWLGQIARNVLRRHHRDHHQEDQEIPLSASPRPDEVAQEHREALQPEAQALSQDFKVQVEELPDPFRTTLLQRYYLDLTVAEIAGKQGISVPLAKYRIRQGLKLLRLKLEVAGKDLWTE